MNRSADVRRPRRPTRAEQYAAGKTIRRRVPRSAHALWEPPAGRVDSVEVLEHTARSLDPRLVPIRFGRMSLSPFAFLRGSAAVMARDLASTPTAGLRVQLCGDAHVANFGVFATPERDLVFDANDFDETLAGPFEWDVKRLATSLVLAARQYGGSPEQAREVAVASVRAYRTQMAQFAREPYLVAWYAHIDRAWIPKVVNRAGRRSLDRTFDEARRRSGPDAFPHLVEKVRGEYRIREEPPLIVHDRRTASGHARALFRAYLRTIAEERRTLLERYELVDTARKVVGVGSVGTDCSVLLLLGDADVLDPIFLQLKEAQSSVWEPHAGPSPFANHAERVVVGQRMVQHASDICLGWTSLGSKDYYVRQLRDMRLSLDLATLGPKGFLGQAELCGASLARAHARTGDPARLSGYLGDKPAFDQAVGAFAGAYARQVEQDLRDFRRAVRSGRVAAVVDM
jgi:uncharacterized protein (DUF2252 family)